MNVDDAVAALVVLEDLERHRLGVDEPHVLDAVEAVDAELVTAVEMSRGRREHLADPVRREREERLIDGHFGHALASPAGEIGDEHVGAQVPLGLEEEAPAARAASAACKRWIEIAPEPGARERVPRRRTRVRVKRAEDLLAHHVRGERREIVVQRWPLRASDHIAVGGLDARRRRWGYARSRRASLSPSRSARTRSPSPAWDGAAVAPGFRRGPTLRSPRTAARNARRSGRLEYSRRAGRAASQPVALCLESASFFNPLRGCIDDRLVATPSLPRASCPHAPGLRAGAHV